MKPQRLLASPFDIHPLTTIRSGCPDVDFAPEKTSERGTGQAIGSEHFCTSQFAELAPRSDGLRCPAVPLLREAFFSSASGRRREGTARKS